MKELNLPPFYVGQKVVCVEENHDAKINTCFKEEIFKDTTYSIVECFMDYLQPCGWAVIVDGSRTHWDAESFAPLQETTKTSLKKQS